MVHKLTLVQTMTRKSVRRCHTQLCISVVYPKATESQDFWNLCQVVAACIKVVPSSVFTAGMCTVTGLYFGSFGPLVPGESIDCYLEV